MVRPIPALLVALLLASACGGTGAGTGADEPSAEAAPGAVTPVTAAPGAVETRPEILRLASLDTLDGDRFDPDAVAGVDVLLWFWGPH